MKRVTMKNQLTFSILFTIYTLMVLIAPSSVMAQQQITVPEGDVEALIAAIEDACLDGGGVTLLLSGTYMLTEPNNNYLGDTGLPVITCEITLEGDGDTVIERDEDALPFRLFLVDGINNGSLRLRNLTLRGGYNAHTDIILSMGGAILVDRGYLYTKNVFFENNISQDLSDQNSWNHSGGGAIANYSGTVEIVSSTFRYNKGLRYGGAINNLGMMTITSSYFHDNDASWYGGVIIASSGTVTVTSSEFAHNRSSYGGVIMGMGGQATFHNSLFHNNTSYRGSIIYNFSSLGIAINNSCLMKNSVPFIMNTYYSSINTIGNWWGWRLPDGPTHISDYNSPFLHTYHLVGGVNSYPILNTAPASCNLSLLPDSDEDGIPDEYDDCPLEYGTSFRDMLGCIDTDSDGWADSEDNCPADYNPDQSDLDWDGLGDVCDDDIDGDGLSNEDEINIYGTDPYNWDTDDDGLSDYDETSYYETDPLLWDTDDDGLGDGDEVYDYDTDPLNPDTDYDGLTDYDEIFMYGTNPLSWDTDGDELSDYDEIFYYETDPLLWDTDDDGLSDYDEIFYYETDPLLWDTDDDGLGDYDELYVYNTDPRNWDTDDDWINDSDEIYEYGTDPLNPDTDGDGLRDGQEINHYGTDPLNPDTDEDGLTDGQEINHYGTDPLNPDTDGDGLTDYDELFVYNTNPHWWDTDYDQLSDYDEIYEYGTDPRNPDTDEDGLSDWAEIHGYGTDPLNPDTDNDGLTDGAEIYGYGTDPLNPDTDEDTHLDGVDDCPLVYGTSSLGLLGCPDQDHDGWADTEDNCPADANPNQADLDDDGLGDVCDDDIDGDGVSNEDEINIYGTDPRNPDTDGDGLNDYEEIHTYNTNPLNPDTDGDGLNDYEEIHTYNTDPLNPDTDGEGLIDGEEVLIYNTNPLNPDTDGDSLNDYEEIHTYHTDPLNPDSDEDGFDDFVDDCPLEFGTSSIDLIGCSDQDEDGWSDQGDNCPTVFNPDQLDSDQNGMGDACEPGPISIFDSTVTVSKTQADADGIDSITITVKPITTYGYPARDVPIQVMVNQDDVIFLSPALGHTDHEGIFTTQISRDGGQGVVQIFVTASDGNNGTVPIGSALVVFSGGDPSISVTGIPRLIAGQTLIYKLTVQNESNLPARDVSVVAGVPLDRASIEHVMTPDGALLEIQAKNSVRWLIPEMGANETYEFMIFAPSVRNLQIWLGSSLDYQQQDIIPLFAQVKAPGDLNSSNDTATYLSRIVVGAPMTTVAQAEKVAIAYNIQPSSAGFGDTVTIQVNVTNLSDDTIYNLEAYSPLQDRVHYRLSPTTRFSLLSPNPLRPDKLEPNETATATLTYLIDDRYIDLNEVARSVFLMAYDSDGERIVTSKPIAEDELTIVGPIPQIRLESSRASAQVGQTIEFTLRIHNLAAAGDTLTDLSIQNLLTGETLTPQQTAIMPGGVTVLTFDYVVQASDVPHLNASVLVTGNAQNIADFSLSQIASVSVRVSAPPVTGLSPDLLLRSNLQTTGFFRELLFPFPLIVENAGDRRAEQVQVKAQIPLGVTVFDTDGAVYNNITRTLTWQMDVLNIGHTVQFTPIILSDRPLGTNFRFEFIANSATPEANLANNVYALTLQIIEPAPAFVDMEFVNQNYVIADGQQAIELRVRVTDQLARPLAGVLGTVRATTTGIELSPLSLVTDADGEALITLRATEVGLTDVIVDFAEDVSAYLTLQRRGNNLLANPDAVTVGVGGSAHTRLTLTNTHPTGDLFDLTVADWDGLDPSWVTIDSLPLAIASGDMGRTNLTINVPPNACSSAGLYQVEMLATDSETAEFAKMILPINITQSPPPLDNVFPAIDARVGAGQVVFSWRSNTAGTGTVYLRPIAGAYTQYAVDASMDDPTFYSVTIPIETIGAYEWWASFETDCGDTQIASSETPRPFHYIPSLTFADRAYDYMIADDYDVRVTTTGENLVVRIRNDDTVTRRVQVFLDNPYDDLTIGLTDIGSLDAALALPPGQTVALNLRVYPQDTEQELYTLRLNLSSPDDPVTDSIPFTLRIQQPVLSLELTQAQLDSRTLRTTAVLVNTGDILTDLDLVVVEQATGRPAPFIILPDVRHAYMNSGESQRIEIVPLAVNDVADTGPYILQATARGQVIEVPITQSGGIPHTLSQVCGYDGSPRMIAASCIVPAGTTTFASSAWYCTNRPNIDVVIPWGFNHDVPIESVTLGIDYEMRVGSVYTHPASIYFNNTLIGSEVISGTKQGLYDVPLFTLINGANHQSLNIRSDHFNEAHYGVATNAHVTVRHGSYQQTACYSSDELEDATILVCSGNSSDCSADITVSHLRVEPVGEQLRLTVRVGNGGTIFVSEDVQVTFYNGNPLDGGIAISTVATTQPLNPGEFEDVSILVPIGITAHPLVIIGDSDNRHPEANEENNIYHSAVYLTTDLSVSSVDARFIDVNPHTLMVSGMIQAEITSTTPVVLPFTVLFFEDRNGNGQYDAGIDQVLGRTVTSDVMPHRPAQIQTSLFGALQFRNSPIYALADVDNAIIELDKTNNIGVSNGCLIASDCDGSLPDLTASHLSVISQDETSISLAVRIGNGGGGIVPAGVSVAFYDGDPMLDGTLIGLGQTTNALASSQFDTVTVVLSGDIHAIPIWVVADDLGGLVGEITEQDELNNIYRSNIYFSNLPNEAPFVDAGDDQTITAPDNSLIIIPTVTDDGLPADVLEVTWELVTGDPDGLLIEYPDRAGTRIVFSTEGEYVLRLTAFDGELSASDTVTLTYVVPPIPPSPQRNVDTPGCITAPAHRSTVNDLSPIVLQTGTNLTDVTVFAWPMNNFDAYRTLATDLTVTNGGQVAVFDPTLWANDTYIIQVTGRDEQGEDVACGIGVYVSGEYKPGRVVVNTTDLTVPVSGLPITIGRTYDSLERDYAGDFGYGWSLAIGAGRLEVDSGENVTLTLPDGTRKTFHFRAVSMGFIFSQPVYINEAGEYGRLTANGCRGVVNTSAGWFCFPGNTYALSITTYTYTDAYGRKFEYGTDGNLKRIIDLNGNVLTFSENGITSSSGLNIIFNRDTNGRITSITDPVGNVYQYHYDANGDLTTVYIPDTPNPLRYNYFTESGWEHFLKDGFDPLNNRVARMDYDDHGRIIRITDALEQVTHYSYDVGNGIQITTNPDGGQIVEQSDTRGNLLRRVDELGRETVYTYDGNNNLLTVTNDLGQVTRYSYDGRGNRTSIVDANGNTVLSATYNGYGAPSRLVDGNGHARNITYDLTSLPVSASDVLGTLGAYTWNEKGDPLTVTDAAGATTSMTYDAYGNVIGQEDARGNVMTMTYDTMGRRTSATDANGTTTLTSYDALGRVLGQQTLDSVGNVVAGITYQYDANGNRTRVTDALGRATVYRYDVTGRVTRVDYPDGTYSATTYDFRGNPLTQRDLTGVVTCYAYDLAGQMTGVTGACGTSEAVTTQYDYDGAGRQIRIIEAVGTPFARITAYTYDNAGRMTQVVIGNGTTVEQSTTYIYDRIGQLIEETNALGVKTQYGYDVRGRRVQTVQAVGTGVQQAYINVYDNAGRVIRQVDPAGIATAYGYDITGNVVTVTQADGTAVQATQQYEYDLMGRRTAIIYPDGGRWETVYDALGRVSQTIDPLGYTRTSAYNILGQLTHSTDANGNTTAYTYDALGRQIGVTYADGTISSTTYADGRMVSTTNPDGISTLYQYDPAGRISAITRGHNTPYQATTQYVYNLIGQQEVVIDGRNNATRYTYDPLGRLVSLLDADNNATTFSYDALGRTLAETDANGNTIQYSYDALNRTTAITHPDGTSQNYTYDGRGLQTGLRDENGLLTRYEYDPQGRLTGVVNPMGQATRYTYDPAGRVTSILDALNHQTQFTYNLRGDQTGRIWADNTFEHYQYDGVGNQTVHTLADGQVNTFTYNALNRLTREDYFDGTIYQYSYTNGGQLHQVRDGAGQILTTYGYDALNRPNQVTHQDGQSVNYTYDAVGNRTAISAPNYAVNYLYDALNQVVGVTDGDGTTSLSYDPVGLLTTIARPNGITTTYDYDNRYFLTGIQHWDSVNDLIAGYAYTYDDVGNRLSQSLSNGVQTTWTYDDAYRLLSETGTGGSFAGHTNYTYDAVGNRLTQTTNGVTTNYTYNALDQLVSDGTSTYNYDSRGNLTHVSDGTLTTLYTWNAQDRLASVSTPVDSVTYSYDYAGRRTGQTVNGISTNYLWDEFSRYGDVLQETNSLGSIQAQYTLVNGQLISQTRDSLTEYYLTDAIGSTHYLTDDSGAITNSYMYDAFGELVKQTGNSQNVYLYAGQQYDELLGTYNMRARVYAPELGRFLSRDAWAYDYQNPVELNRYVYGANNPVRFTDPSGYMAVMGYQLSLNRVSFASSSLAFVGFKLNVKMMMLIHTIVIGVGVSGIDDYFRDLLFPDDSAYQPPARTSPEDLIWGGSQDNVNIDNVTISDAIDFPLTKTFPQNYSRDGIIPYFHYGSMSKISFIFATQSIPHSDVSTNPQRARYGSGVYFTDLVPGTLSKGQISRRIYGSPLYTRDIEAWIMINVFGLPIQFERANVFLVPRNTPLPIMGKILAIGLTPDVPRNSDPW